ncbi:MAG: PrgI family protein [Patescibacteria group bacterium]|nr:PrgI family protein [Patescibacteria group bacterium]
MAFIVPKFIEKEAKIIGPLTFRQFVYVGIAVIICFILFFIAPKIVFYASAIILIPIGIALGLTKIKGISLPDVLKNFFFFSISQRIFLWKRKAIISKIGKEEKEEKDIKGLETSSLKTFSKSKLKDLSSRIET